MRVRPIRSARWPATGHSTMPRSCQDHGREVTNGRRKMQLSGGIGGQVQREIGARGAHERPGPRRAGAPLSQSQTPRGWACGVRGLDEFRSLVDFAPDIHADRTHQQSEKKGHAPTPCVQLVSRERAGQHKSEKRGEQFRYLLAGHLPTGGKAFAVGCVLDHKGCRAAELAGHGEALGQTRCEDGNGRKQTDRTVRRHDGHYARADDHELNG